MSRGRIAKSERETEKFREREREKESMKERANNGGEERERD